MTATINGVIRGRKLKGSFSRRCSKSEEINTRTLEPLRIQFGVPIEIVEPAVV
jgi:hypothetical protein